MLKIQKTKRCVNCFCEITAEPCIHCGYEKNVTIQDADVLPQGTKLVKRYLLGGVIGRGGFGITYLAYDFQYEKLLAVKEYFPSNIAIRDRKTLSAKPLNEKKSEAYQDGLKSFLEESARISQFNGNPNIVNVFDSFCENNTAYYVMEYLSGITLEQYIGKNGALSVEQGVYLAEKMGMALSAVHSAGLVHRDVAPDNIMLCEDGRLKLLDFGTARKLAEATSLTVMMKTGFTPVEQYSSGKDVSARTDIYALGMVLFYALTEKQPKSVFLRMEDDTDFARMLWAVPRDFKEVIMKAAAIRSANRYESASDFLRAVSDMKIRGECIVVDRKESVKGPFPKSDFKIRKKALAIRTKAMYLAGGLFLGMALGVLVLHFSSQGVNEPLTNPEEASKNTAPSENAAPVVIEFGSYEKSFSSQYLGRITRNMLEAYEGNVKITLEIETVSVSYNKPETYLIFPEDDSGNNMLSYCVTDSPEAPTVDSAGGIPVGKEEKEFSIILSAEGIEALDGGFGFETYNVAIKKVFLEACDTGGSPFLVESIPLPEGELAEYQVSYEQGRPRVSVNLSEYCINDWGGMQMECIPVSVFDSFSGDVKMTFHFSYEPKEDPEGNNGYQLFYMYTYGLLQNHITEFAEVVPVYDENGLPLVKKSDSMGIWPALECTECSVIFPKSVVRKLCGAISISGDNMRVTNVLIEDAY